MQTINKVLLVAGALGGLFYGVGRERSRGEYERQVGALAAALDRRQVSAEESGGGAEAQYLRALAIYADYRSLRNAGRVSAGEEEYLREALGAAGYGSAGEMGLVVRGLRENLGVCLEMKVLEDGGQALWAGREPTIMAGSFAGDSLAVRRRVAGELAPELANHPANFVLVPSLAGAMMWPLVLGEGSLRAVEEFRAQGLLEAKVAQALRQRAEELRAVLP